jgi:hypothetical protein
MLEEFLNFMFYFAISYVVSTFLFSFIEGYFQEKQQMQREVMEVLESIVHIVKMEKHGDITYWFDKDSDQFLAQGETTAEIIFMLKQKFPTHLFLVNDKFLFAGPEFMPIDLSDSEAYIQHLRR